MIFKDRIKPYLFYLLRKNDLWYDAAPWRR
jgi:hypothetical protein